MAVTAAARIGQLHQIYLHRNIWRELTLTDNVHALDSLIAKGYRIRVSVHPEQLTHDDLLKRLRACGNGKTLSDQASPFMTETIKALRAVALQKPLHAVPSLYKMNKWQNYQVYDASIHKRGTRLEVEFVPNTLGKKMSLGDLLLA